MQTGREKKIYIAEKINFILTVTDLKAKCQLVRDDALNSYMLISGSDQICIYSVNDVILYSKNYGLDRWGINRLSTDQWYAIKILFRKFYRGIKIYYKLHFDLSIFYGVEVNLSNNESNKIQHLSQLSLELDKLLISRFDDVDNPRLADITKDDIELYQYISLLQQAEQTCNYQLQAITKAYMKGIDILLSYYDKTLNVTIKHPEHDQYLSPEALKIIAR